MPESHRCARLVSVDSHRHSAFLAFSSLCLSLPSQSLSLSLPLSLHIPHPPHLPRAATPSTGRYPRRLRRRDDHPRFRHHHHDSIRPNFCALPCYHSKRSGTRPRPRLPSSLLCSISLLSTRDRRRSRPGQPFSIAILPAAPITNPPHDGPPPLVIPSPHGLLQLSEA